MSSSPFSNSPSPFTEPSFFSNASSEHPVEAPVQARPALDATEVESASGAIEIIVRWGTDILHIEHMERPRAFSVGEDGDFALPADKLGMNRVELVTVEGDRVYAVVLPDAQAKVMVSGRTLLLADAVAEGRAMPDMKSGGSRVALIDGTRVVMERAGFELEVAAVNAGRKVAGKVGGDKRAFGGQAMSFAIHGAILATMFAFMPALASTDEGDVSQEQTYMLQMLLNAEQDRVRELDETLKSEESKPEEAMAPSNAPANSDKGKMGKSAAPVANKRHAISTDEKERSLDKAAAIRDAQTFGMIDLIGTLSTPAADVASSPWGKVASGPDAQNANGLMWADEIGDAFGSGLDLSGTGERGGGPFGGTYLGQLGTIGGGDGTCTGAFCGGTSGGFLPSTHKAGGPPAPRVGPMTLSGRIPPEVIQRVVRQSFGRFRGCYEAGLRTNPNLSGRVVVAFTVGRDGSVGMVGNGGSDLPDANVVSCVVKQFYGLSFPAPDGMVKVTYPIMFNPG